MRVNDARSGGSGAAGNLRRMFWISCSTVLALAACDNNDLNDAYIQSDKLAISHTRDLAYSRSYDIWTCLRRHAQSRINQDECRSSADGLTEELILPQQITGLPVLRVHRSGMDEASPERIIIYLVGGPFSSLYRIERNHPFFEDWPASTVLDMPLYPGTTYRSHGNAVTDFENSIIELNEYLLARKQASPNAEILLILESFGSFFGSRLDADGIVDGIMFLGSPIGFSGGELDNYFLANSTQDARDFDWAIVPRVPNAGLHRKLIRYHYMKQLLEEIDEQDVVQQKLFTSDVCHIMVFGANDGFLDDGTTRMLAQNNQTSRVIIPDQGHQFDFSIGKLVQLKEDACRAS